MAMGGATQVVYVTTVELFGNGGAAAAAIIVAVFVYGLSLWLTKAVVKADMYHFPVIGKRLQAREIRRRLSYMKNNTDKPVSVQPLVDVVKAHENFDSMETYELYTLAFEVNEKLG